MNANPSHPESLDQKKRILLDLLARQDGQESVEAVHAGPGESKEDPPVKAAQPDVPPDTLPLNNSEDMARKMSYLEDVMCRMEEGSARSAGPGPGWNPEPPSSDSQEQEVPGENREADLGAEREDAASEGERAPNPLFDFWKQCLNGMGLGAFQSLLEPLFPLMDPARLHQGIILMMGLETPIKYCWPVRRVWNAHPSGV